MEQRKCRQPMIAVGVVVLLSFIDQVSKYYARLWLEGSDFEVTSFLKCTLLYNKGISWSLLTPTTANGEYALMFGIVVLLMIYILHLANEMRRGRTVFPELLIIGGATSNLIDRFMHGGVVDFIMVYYQQYQFPVFNFADVFIFIGFLLFVRKGFCNESC
ncbi:signal peptidase II [Candidatus Babeliales bacterium]|nr:signal peptidase II [Candidatus Babeliales bacterium]